MDPKVIEVAEHIRHGIEARRERYWSQDLSGACAVASYALCRALSWYGYRATFICWDSDCNEGWSHCWVELEGVIIDLTATQFNYSLPRIVICPRDQYKVLNLKKGKIRRGKSALHFTKNWPKYQNPHKLKDLIGEVLQSLPD